MQTADSAIFVVDTNVWCAAEPESTFGDQCRRASLQFVRSLVESDLHIAVDADFLILGEYYTNLSQQFAPYHILGNLNRRGDVLHRQITTTDGIADIPQMLERTIDDKADRKFVAVSLSFSPPSRPPVVNATDPGWKDWEEALARFDVEVVQLCPELSSRSHSSAQHQT